MVRAESRDLARGPPVPCVMKDDKTTVMVMESSSKRVVEIGDNDPFTETSWIGRCMASKISNTSSKSSPGPQAKPSLDLDYVPSSNEIWISASVGIGLANIEALETNAEQHGQAVCGLSSFMVNMLSSAIRRSPSPPNAVRDSQMMKQNGVNEWNHFHELT